MSRRRSARRRARREAPRASCAPRCRAARPRPRPAEATATGRHRKAAYRSPLYLSPPRQADNRATEADLLHALAQHFGMRLRSGGDLEAVEATPPRVAALDHHSAQTF